MLTQRVAVFTRRRYSSACSCCLLAGAAATDCPLPPLELFAEAVQSAYLCCAGLATQQQRTDVPHQLALAPVVGPVAAAAALLGAAGRGGRRRT